MTINRVLPVLLVYWGWNQYGMEDISFLSGSTDTVRNPGGSVYDLDCASGWISWL